MTLSHGFHSLWFVTQYDLLENQSRCRVDSSYMQWDIPETELMGKIINKVMHAQKEIDDTCIPFPKTLESLWEELRYIAERYTPGSIGCDRQLKKVRHQMRAHQQSMKRRKRESQSPIFDGAGPVKEKEVVWNQPGELYIANVDVTLVYSPCKMLHLSESECILL